MPSTTLLRRAAATAAALACAGAAAAAPAGAEILTYSDGTNVWAENVDGSQRRAITTDGSADLPYHFATANDAGDIVSLRYERRSGNYFVWFFAADGAPPVVNLLPTPGSYVMTTPYTVRLQPEGRLLAYTYMRGSINPGPAGNVVPADAPGSPGGNPFPGGGQGFPGMFSATWHAGKLVWSNTSHTAYGYGNEADAWITDANWAEVSRDASRVLARVRNETGGSRLAFQAMRGPMPSVPDETVGGCFVNGAGGTIADQALSPSARWIAWRDQEGLHAAQIDLSPGTDPNCTISNKRLLAASGDDPSFSNFTYVPPQDRRPEDPRRPVEDPRRPSDDDRDGGRTPAAKPRIAVVRASLRTALSKGLTVRLSGLPKGATTVRAKRGRTVVASGRARVGASGRATVRLRFTKAARRSLRRLRGGVRLTIVAGKAKATAKLR